MPGSVKYSGICSTCKNAPTCAYLEGTRDPVLQCEEFEPYETPEKKVRRDTCPSRRVASAADAEGGESATLMGLCKSCEHRKDCQYRKPEGGVRHCEEFE